MSRTPDADGWVSLSDAQWTNIVNHDHAYQGMSKDDAVHLAVKMTEAKCRELNVDAKATAKLRDSLAIAAMQMVSWYGEAAKTSPAKCWQIADDMLAARSAI
jgi:hypothetical protein